MFTIVKAARQILNTARTLHQAASASINKYQVQSKGYIEDARDEFIFLKALPNQSLIQDKLSSFYQEANEVSKPQSTDRQAIRKLIYARFADEIVAKPKNVADTNSQNTKEYIDAVAINNITDEFKALREHGYNFKELRSAIINHNLAESENIEESGIRDNSSINNSINKGLSDRMKELVISGYMSSYSGEPYLRQDIEEVMNRKFEVIKECMHIVKERADVVTGDSAVLMLNSENDEVVTDIAKTDLLGEY